MKKEILTIIFLILSSMLPAAQKKIIDHWKQWLNEVDPIMSQVERNTFKLLKVEEDRLRFREMFWKARDPNPHTPANEYQAVYYRRLKHVESKLEGKNSDRGRIYLIMGEPATVTTFVGYQDLVECELWHYRTDPDSGLVPFITLLFFKPNDTGWFELFHPGIHTQNDLLSPFNQIKNFQKREAYRLLTQQSEELAMATLSVIPGEVNPNAAVSTGSSSFVMQKIYTKPERDAARDYLKNFTMPEGYVSVDTSTREIRGHVNMALGRNRDFLFLHFAVMPDVLETVKTGADRYIGKINIVIRIEDLQGQVVFQNERKMDLSFDKTRYARIRENKMVFRDFVPIVEGSHHVTVTFMNKTTGDFFSTKEQIRTDEALPVLMGFGMRDLPTAQYASYSDESMMVLSDPRFLFTTEDQLEGMVFTDQAPVITLKNDSPDGKVFTLDNLSKKDKKYYFTHPLAGTPDGTYHLSVSTSDGKTFTQKIFILPPYIKKRRCLASEKAESLGSAYNYIFILGQEYFQKKAYRKALEMYQRLPEKLWNSKTLPVIVQSYYALKEYQKVLDLLEREDIKKTYGMLSMMANCAIELKRTNQAIGYLKELQRYQDTAAINYSLSALYLSMGDRETAKKYHQKAKNFSLSGEGQNKME